MTLTLDDMNDRTREIFRELVNGYLLTGEPMASRTLSRLQGINLSAATIRNVMADLEDAGLLRSPHTSAGRIPTDKGLRFFVDGMMQLGDLAPSERAKFKARYPAKGQRSGDLGARDLLSEATKILSDLSHCASMVFVPEYERYIKHLEFVFLSPGQAMVILVSDDGQVENRLMDIPLGTPPSSLEQAANFLNARLGGKTLQQVRCEMADQHLADEKELDAVASGLVEKGIAVWSGDRNKSEGIRGSLIVSGQSKLLDNISAQDDLERVKDLLEALESKRAVVDLLDQAREARGVRIFIGSENKYFGLSGSSLIAAPYMNGTNTVVGVIGIIGPTRLNYAKIIPMVDYTAQLMTRLMGKA